ncbi:hypothetical protein F7725_014118 [Dissostichus mawsoni]|uniref:Uncharacterized protein n=1 Tax=Dissostichus mawsoni TaxID=36200 RepID=A0A7J5YVF7_DISMA|nr:hypothetical protein F7725_014118 [Dissostichus mawsoni]
MERVSEPCDSQQVFRTSGLTRRASYLCCDSTGSSQTCPSALEASGFHPSKNTGLGPRDVHSCFSPTLRVSCSRDTAELVRAGLDTEPPSAGPPVQQQQQVLPVEAWRLKHSPYPKVEHRGSVRSLLQLSHEVLNVIEAVIEDPLRNEISSLKLCPDGKVEGWLEGGLEHICFVTMTFTVPEGIRFLTPAGGRSRNCACDVVTDLLCLCERELGSGIPLEEEDVGLLLICTLADQLEEGREVFLCVYGVAAEDGCERVVLQLILHKNMKLKLNGLNSNIQEHLLTPQLFALSQEGESGLGLLHIDHLTIFERECQQNNPMPAVLTTNVKRSWEHAGAMEKQPLPTDDDHTGAPDSGTAGFAGDEMQEVPSEPAARAGGTARSSTFWLKWGSALGSATSGGFHICAIKMEEVSLYYCPPFQMTQQDCFLSVPRDQTQCCPPLSSGSFLLLYVLLMLIMGIPLFFLELAAGQAIRQGSIGVWKFISPRLAGIGYSSCVVCFFVALYYNVILAWSLFYLGNSFQSSLPWEHCPVEGNVTVPECKKSSPTSYFWYRKALDITDSIDETGSFNPYIVGCLLAAWTLVCLGMFKGIKTSVKVMYFSSIFPYVVLFCFLVRGLMLDGA